MITQVPSYMKSALFEKGIQLITFTDIDSLEEVIIEDFGEFDGCSILYIALLFDTYYMLYIVLLEDFTDYLWVAGCHEH